MIPSSEWKWFGNAGHFICGHYCRFHLCTQVGEYLISTIGEYVPDSLVREILATTRGVRLKGQGDDRLADWMEKAGFEDIGFGRKFETIVFKAGKACNQEGCDCGFPAPDDWTELDMEGYNSPGDATRGHYAMCQKYASGTTTNE